MVPPDFPFTPRALPAARRAAPSAGEAARPAAAGPAAGAAGSAQERSDQSKSAPATSTTASEQAPAPRPPCVCSGCCPLAALLPLLALLGTLSRFPPLAVLACQGSGGSGRERKAPTRRSVMRSSDTVWTCGGWGLGGGLMCVYVCGRRWGRGRVWVGVGLGWGGVERRAPERLHRMHNLHHTIRMLLRRSPSRAFFFPCGPQAGGKDRPEWGASLPCMSSCSGRPGTYVAHGGAQLAIRQDTHPKGEEVAEVQLGEGQLRGRGYRSCRGPPAQQTAQMSQNNGGPPAPCPFGATGNGEGA